MKTNTKATPVAGKKTHGGVSATSISKIDELRRSLMSCLLWEKTFYESGESIATRLERLAKECSPQLVADLAVEARESYKLRHAPLLLAKTLSCSVGGALATETIQKVIRRPDELAELLALYWSEGKKPIPASMKRGLAKAFHKFDEYQFAKWNRPNEIKIRDVMFQVHPKARDKAEAALFKRIADDTLATPNTWESRLAGGEDKARVFAELLQENKLGYMALLRNLRNMQESGVDPKLVENALLNNNSGMVLPYRFIAAARQVPAFEPVLDKAMQRLLQNHQPLEGHTAILVDVSGSMEWGKTGHRSDLTYLDAACGLAILLEGICDKTSVYTFSNQTKSVAPRKGMALADAIKTSQAHGGTDLGGAVSQLFAESWDRLVVFTDEQSQSAVPQPKQGQNTWMINVATYQNGVGYGNWKHIDGFSEATVKYIQEYEKEFLQG